MTDKSIMFSGGGGDNQIMNKYRVANVEYYIDIDIGNAVMISYYLGTLLKNFPLCFWRFKFEEFSIAICEQFG